MYESEEIGTSISNTFQNVKTFRHVCNVSEIFSAFQRKNVTRYVVRYWPKQIFKVKKRLELFYILSNNVTFI